MIDSGTRMIDFKIRTKGYEFDARDGIKFTTVNQGDQHFDCTPQGSSGKDFRCTVHGAIAGAFYKYGIHIANLDPVDPWVVNY